MWDRCYIFLSFLFFFLYFFLSLLLSVCFSPSSSLCPIYPIPLFVTTIFLRRLKSTQKSFRRFLFVIFILAVTDNYVYYNSSMMTSTMRCTVATSEEATTTTTKKSMSQRINEARNLREPYRTQRGSRT